MSTRFDDISDLARLLGFEFSDEQVAAITAPLEPGVIIAGAGTGKTTVMAARVVWLVGRGLVQPEEVLGLTFTRKAAGELAGRISTWLTEAGVAADPEHGGAELILTYDSFAARLVGEFGLRIGLEREPLMITGASRFRLAARAVTAATGPFHKISRLTHHSIPERVLDLDGDLESHLVDAAALREFTARASSRFDAAPLWRGAPYKSVSGAQAVLGERLELLELVEAYQALKAERGLVEYADQLRRAVRLATEVPAVGAILRQRFRVVLLDEYQDTSSAQAMLLEALFSGEAGRGFPVTAVGDPHQAIYGWRGAAATNILEFPTRFPLADGSPAPRRTLSINRRSGQEVLDVGNGLAAALDVVAGATGVSLVAPEGTPSAEIVAMRFDTEVEEFEWIVQELIERHAHGVQWSQIALLARRNQTISSLFEVLREHDVPAEVVGLGGLLHLPEIAPIVATLRVLDDVAANADVVALLSGPRWAIGLADLEALAARARALAGRAPSTSGDLAEQLEGALAEADPAEAVSLLDAVSDPGDAALTDEGRRRVTEFAAEIAELRRHVVEPVPELVRRVVARLGLDVEVRARGAGNTAQVQRFISSVSDYVDVDGDGSLAGFLAWLDAEETHGVGLEQAVPSPADSVKLLTVHRAKGLEWDTVVLPSLVDGVFPSRPRGGNWLSGAQTIPSPLRGDAGGIPQLGSYDNPGIKRFGEDVAAEHRRSEDRLAYVAATRAKRRLVATTHVWTPGLKRPRAVSPYFGTIEEHASSTSAVVTAEVNPHPETGAVAEWPARAESTLARATREAADLVSGAMSLLGMGAEAGELEEWVWRSGTATPSDFATLRRWDDEADALAEQFRRRRSRDVVLPEGLSATALMNLATDPAAFAQTLVRPMPRRPSVEARRGARFHAWVENRFAAAATFDEFDQDVAHGDDPLLTRLITAFEAGRFGPLQPIAVEVPFLLNWRRHVLRGRIDAVYAWDGKEFDVMLVDWKTSNKDADPLQLAVYQQAWSQAHCLDPQRVGVGFHHVLSNEFRIVDAPLDLIDDALAAEEHP